MEKDSLVILRLIHLEERLKSVVDELLDLAVDDSRLHKQQD